LSEPSLFACSTIAQAPLSIACLDRRGFKFAKGFNFGKGFGSLILE
jgi:hypothetical protein